MKRKNKIALAIDYYPLRIGGMETHAYEFNKFLNKQKEFKFTAMIGFSPKKESEILTDAGKLILLSPKAIFQPKFIYQTIKKLNFSEGDILFFNSLYWIRVISYLRSKFPRVLFVMRSGGNDIAQSEIKDRGLTLKERRNFTVRVINNSIDILIVNSNYSFKKLNRFGIKKTKMEIVTGGVDTNKFKPVPKKQKIKLRKCFKLPQNKVIILSCCRLVPFKGINNVLKAISKSKSKNNIYYLLIGDGEEKLKIESLIEKLQLKNLVTILGEAPINSIHLYYQTSDIYCHAPILVRNSVLGGSYIHTETMGRSFCEAMATGLPVISSRVGGVPEIVDDGKSGIIVPSRDITSLTLAIDYLLKNKSKRREIGLYGRKLAKKFSWKKNFREYFSLFKNFQNE